MVRKPGWGVPVIIAVATMLRLVLAGSIGPGNDEAYYALYLDHPDWSYYDHPPMVAVVAGLGRWLGGGHRSVMALRVGFVAMFAGSTWLVARLARRAYGDRAAAPAALALNASWYFGAAAGTFVLPDGPLLFFWLLTLDRLMSAVEGGGRVGPWLGVGLAWGAALLSKYHAVFLPVVFLGFAMIDPAARRCLRTAGPFLAGAVGLLAFSPVIAWNARHDWASFAFQGARATGAIRFDLLAMLGALAAQAFYLLPWIALALMVVFVRLVRRSGFGAVVASRPHPDRTDSNADADATQGLDRTRWDRLFLVASALPIGFFAAVALIKPVLPHWGLIGAAGLMPALGEYWADRRSRWPRSTNRRLALIALAPVVLTAVAVVHSKTGWLQAGGSGPLALIPAEADPSRDLVGWDQIAGELRQRGLLDRPDTFLFTGHWHVSGQLAQAVGTEVPVLCYHEGDARGFASWSEPNDWVGRDGVLVAIDDRSTEPQCFDRWFSRIEPIAEFTIDRGGLPVRPVRLFLCINQTRPFPFNAPP